MKNISVIIDIIIIVLGIAFETCLWIAYGNKPVSEIPAWIMFFMLKS